MHCAWQAARSSSMPEVAMPLDRLLLEGTRRLTEASMAEPRRQAYRIWAELNCSTHPGAELMQKLEVGAEATARYQNAIERRASGEPLAHVTGISGFRLLTLRSDARAL